MLMMRFGYYYSNIKLIMPQKLIKIDLLFHCVSTITFAKYRLMIRCVCLCVMPCISPPLYFYWCCHRGSTKSGWPQPAARHATLLTRTRTFICSLAAYLSSWQMQRVCLLVRCDTVSSERTRLFVWARTCIIITNGFYCYTAYKVIIRPALHISGMKKKHWAHYRLSKWLQLHGLFKG